MHKDSIYQYTLTDLEDKLVSLGLKKFNAKQIFDWIYKKQVKSFALMNNIAKTSIAILEENFYFDQFHIIKTLIDQNDETTKFLIELSDHEIIETVLMKFDYGYSICVSSQIGCNMGCKFCASGLLKKVRNLATNEIVYQYVLVNEYLRKNKNSHLSNMVVMGIGEPFDNYDNLKNALKIINEDFGLGLGARRITVSTCGLVPKIIQYAHDFKQFNLALSLHASTQEKRMQIMPIAHAYHLDEVINAIKEYIKITNRRVTFEYIMLKDVNDTDEDLKHLIKLCKNLLCYVNLIRYNPVDENDFSTSSRAYYFMNELNKYHITATVRLERGTKIAAACGQLRAKYEKTKN